MHRTRQINDAQGRDISANYHVKALKRGTGHEGETVFKGTLCLDGKKLGEWAQDDWGGPFRLEVADPTQKSAFTLFVMDWFAKSGELARTQAQYNAWDDEAGRPRREVEVDGATAAEYWLLNEAERIEEEKYLERHSKTKTLFRTRDAEEGGWRTYMRAYSAAMDAFVRERHGADLVEIYVPLAFRSTR